jgi:hypothetical protein
MNSRHSFTAQTRFDSDLNAHVLTLDPPIHHAVSITITITSFEHEHDLEELFLYHFDRDGNSIEFAFGEKEHGIRRTRTVTYCTDPRIHRPPFSIQITHQVEEISMQGFSFEVGFESVENFADPVSHL